MTLNAVFRWKHPDSTLDMNKRLQTLVPRGIFDGGAVTPGAGLTVMVTPFKAISYDGMLVYDDAVQTLAVAAPAINYILVRAKYASGTTPTVQWEVKTQAQYNADPDKDYLIVFGVVTLAPGAVAVLNADISLLERDAVDPMQRSSFRGQVADPTLLPAHPPAQNHDGDFYFVLNAGGGLPGQTFYYWESATLSWETFATGSYNVETTSMADVLIQGERNRIEQGSGIIAGKRPAAFGYPANTSLASDLDIALIESPAVANQIGFDTFSAIINGHYVQPHARYVTMSAKPAGPGDRYDMIFLECWREAITTPENWDYSLSPNGAVTETISQVSDRVETIAWQTGLAGGNMDLNELQNDNHAWTVTRYRVGVINGVGVAALYDNTVGAALAVNVDSAAFVATPGTGVDPRVWQAPAAVSSVDGYSYAIPLFVIRRTPSEDHTAGDAIKEFRNYIRHVFPVYPVTDTGNATRLALDSQYRNAPTINADYISSYDKASGFLETPFEITTSGAANTIKFASENARIRIRGYEENLEKITANLGAPPGFGTYDRALVYIKMSITRYADQNTRPNVQISQRHRPWLPHIGWFSTDNLRGGWKRGYVSFETVVEVFPDPTSVLDEDDAMAATAVPWTKGDLLNGALGKEYEDGGVWSRTVAVDVDDRIHPYEVEWAIPVCLVHRRNSGAWHYHTNPNGTGATRPDDRTDATVIHPDDLVDLRHLVDVDEARMQLILEEDIDKLMRGQLRTRLANKWAGGGTGGAVAGSRILQTDCINKGPMAGVHNIVQMDHKKIYSDAREFQPISVSFPLDNNYGGAGDPVQYVVATGVLTIRAPTGAHIVRNLPSAYIVNANTTNTTYLDFLGQPCWTTQRDKTAVYPTPATLRWIDAVSGNHEEQVVFEADGSNYLTEADPVFAISVRDSLDRATEMTISLGDGSVFIPPYGSADILCVSYWIHYDRTITGVDYADNYGLAEIPDEVHQAIKGPVSGIATELNIGVLYTIVRKTVAGAASVVITGADVLAASGTSGATAVILGIGNVYFGGAGALAGIEVSTDPLGTINDTLTISFTGVINTDVEVLVFYYTDDVTQWIEVGRGGKSVRSLFEWHEEAIDFGGGAPAQWAFDIGSSTWHHAEVAGMYWPMPIILTNVTGVADDPWTQISFGVTGNAGYVNSNLFAFRPSGVTGMQQYCRVVFPKWTATTNALADDVLITYTYTPYQGLSSDGGIATPVTAIPDLKAKLHGKIVANSDHYVSQSGACSVFGGVDTWSGKPARVPALNGSMGTDRFGAYNMTQLVKPTKANGLIELSTPSGLAETMYAAAIMRLPFPMHPLMIKGGVYHEGTMDFDIDPGREGASVGFFGYAPGYSNKYVVAHANGLQYSLFVNGVYRLCLPGEPRQTDRSHEVWASEYQLTVLNKSTASLGHTYLWYVPTGADPFYAAVPLHQNKGDIIGLITTYASMSSYAVGTDYAITCWNSFFPTATPGMYTYLETPPPSFTSLIAFPGASNPAIPVLLCYNPGTVLAYLSQAGTVDASVYIHAESFGNFGGTVGNTTIVQEASRASYTAGDVGVYGPYVCTDLVRIPMGSSSSCNILPIQSRPVSSAIGNSSLRGRVVAYPDSWGATTITTLESFLLASTSIHANYGRGLYFGATDKRLNMPVMVPGSGDGLAVLIAGATLLEQTAQPPASFPVGPEVAPFATSPKRFLAYDHGGPLGYCFYGLVINPTANAQHGRAVMQISGGPTMGNDSDSSSYYSSDILDGTAIDAFWPSKRPILKTGQ